jgi:EAL domain-containing protein (putative c-di-GMP-specific phosphodiesterase class I)
MNTNLDTASVYGIFLFKSGKKSRHRLLKLRSFFLSRNFWRLNSLIKDGRTLQMPNPHSSQPPAEQPFLTFEQSILDIKTRLVKDFKLGMLLIDAGSLRIIEENYGKTIYENIFESLKKTIIKLKEIQRIRKDDIVVINEIEGECFYIFFSRQRNEGKFHISDYEALAERIQTFINNNMFSTIFPLLKEKQRVNVGYAITFNNPSVKEERLLQSLIADARVMAQYQELKNRMSYKEIVYELIIDKKIKTYYQPIVDLNTHAIIGYEALSRGPHDTEYENPYVLFSIAKEIGLLYELDWLCKINIFNEARKLEQNLKLFVNIFSSSIHDSEIRVKYLEDLLKDTKIKPNDVVFEISEKYAIEDADFFNEITRLYENTSFAVAIDDTWAGTNIALLSGLKIQFIKISISLIRDIEKHRVNREFIESLLAIASKVGAHVIAEGIQTKTELKALIDLGIQLGQGYLFAHPAPSFPQVNITEIYLEDQDLKNRLLSSVFYKRGLDYFKKGQFDQCILEFTKVVEIDPNNIEAIYHIAHAYYEDECYGMALREITRLLELSPEYSNAYFTQGLIFEKLKHVDEAITAYKEYIRIAPSIFQSNIDLANKRLDALVEQKSQ